jgi:hypothetical protein
MKKILKAAISVAAVLSVASSVAADEFTPNPNATGEALTQKSYSPYADRNFPTRLLWGDTHLHTNLSLDARAGGVILSPGDAFRFARGEEVTASGGFKIKLGQPLDFLVVTDHSDAMGAMNEVIKGNPNLLTDPTVKDWHTRINAGGQTALEAAYEVVQAIANLEVPKVLSEPAFYYARIIEIPTPRWTAYEAKYFKVEAPKESPMTTQERAYTSSIWYTP